MRLVEFVAELVDLLTCPQQRFSSRGSNPVHPPAVSCVLMHGLQQPRAFQSMQQRVKRARPDAIAVMRELFHHRKAKDRLLARVQQHVNANQAVEEFALVMHDKTHYTGIYTIFP